MNTQHQIQILIQLEVQILTQTQIQIWSQAHHSLGTDPEAIVAEPRFARKEDRGASEQGARSGGLGGHGGIKHSFRKPGF